MLEALIFVVFPFCMVFAAVSDMLSMTIANRVSVVLVAAFAVVAPLTGMDWATYGWHFAAAGLVLVVTFLLFAIGGMGGGDAKLMAATALWMGFNLNLLGYLVTSAFIGGLLTLAILIYRKSPLADMTGSQHVPSPFRRSAGRRALWRRARPRRTAHLSRLAAHAVGDGPPFRPLNISRGRMPAKRRAPALQRLFSHANYEICINVKLITIVRIALTVI